MRVRPLFALGQVVATPAALEALRLHTIDPMELLTRHVTGDWGDLHAEDAAQNEIGVLCSNRILSSYVIGDTSLPLWIVTEADRSVTTLLLPEDY
ncbi:MAG: hypothetical protein EOP24_19090 [Hyphomicrobiales bacterium]|nr:MAG: hypothetical protein EOP24_19090 [Hyphomicrobiales bacterium]